METSNIIVAFISLAVIVYALAILFKMDKLDKENAKRGSALAMFFEKKRLAEENVESELGEE